MNLIIERATAEHRVQLELLRDLQDLTEGRAASASADPPWGALMFGVRELADDLAANIHLKEQVLFPRFYRDGFLQ